MSLQDNKLLEFVASIAALPNTVKNSAAWLKQQFDGRAEELRVKHNSLVDALDVMELEKRVNSETIKSIRIGSGGALEITYDGTSWQAVTQSDAPAVPGVPLGGAQGNVLRKNSATNYDTAWSDTVQNAMNLGGCPPEDYAKSIELTETNNKFNWASETITSGTSSWSVSYGKKLSSFYSVQIYAGLVSTTNSNTLVLNFPTALPKKFEQQNIIAYANNAFYTGTISFTSATRATIIFTENIPSGTQIVINIFMALGSTI